MKLVKSVSQIALSSLQNKDQTCEVASSSSQEETSSLGPGGASRPPLLPSTLMLVCLSNQLFVPIFFHSAFGRALWDHAHVVGVGVGVKAVSLSGGLIPTRAFMPAYKVMLRLKEVHIPT